MRSLRPRPRARNPDDRRGVAALEYALLAGVVAISLIGVVVHFAAAESALFGAIGNALTQGTTAPAPGGSGSGSGTGSGGGTHGGPGGGGD